MIRGLGYAHKEKRVPIAAEIQRDGMRSELWNLDPAFPQAFIIFLARVFHHLPVRTEDERSRIRPWLREGLGVIDGYFVANMAEVRA
jgi:hypothetical protein